MSEFIKVKALDQGGDWFLVPNDLMDVWEKYTAIIDNEDESSDVWMDACDRFEEYFGHMRTEGDLNNVQLYRK